MYCNIPIVQCTIRFQFLYQTDDLNNFNSIIAKMVILHSSFRTRNFQLTIIQFITIWYIFHITSYFLHVFHSNLINCNLPSKLQILLKVDLSLDWTISESFSFTKAQILLWQVFLFEICTKKIKTGLSSS